MAEILLLADLSEWELYHAALFARVCLILREAAVYELVSGDFKDIDLERCEEIVAFADDQGIELSADAVDAALIGALGKAAACG